MSSKLQSERKCKSCRKPFIPVRSLQQVCSWECAKDKAEKDRLTKEAKEATMKRSELRKAKADARPLKYYEDKAQVAVNRWIVHVRDKHLPCITCGTNKPNVQYAAGHYRTRKAASQLRYNEDNIHKQCNSYCNYHLSGNIANYRSALIAKIGQERHDALINNHESKRWTREECEEIEKIYKGKLKKHMKYGN